MKFILSLLFAMSVNMATAKEYVLINPNAPGSSSEVTARVIAEAYKRQTGNTLVVESVGGGNQIPGAVRFKNMAKPGLILTTSSLLVFNPKTIKDLPYNDEDFVPISPVGLTPQTWIVRAESPYKTMQDLVKELPTSPKNFVGYANPVEVANLHILSQHYKWKPKSVEPIKYKGTAEVLTAMLANDIEVAIVSHAPVIDEHVKSGKLRILANTTDQTIQLAGQSIPSVRRQLGVGQVTGGVLIASSPKMDTAEANQLHQDIINAIKDPQVQENLAKRNQFGIGYGVQPYTQFINQLRTSMQNIDL
jgi:tripartite-type tricarboxylate transporter receptor subunit TctC